MNLVLSLKNTFCVCACQYASASESAGASEPNIKTHLGPHKHSPGLTAVLAESCSSSSQCVSAWPVHLPMWNKNEKQHANLI